MNIAQIAKLAGVSKTTVSFVFNDKAAQHKISPNVRKRVLDIAEKNDYIPNQNARGLRLKKTQTLGLVIPDLQNWFFAELSHSVEQVARSRGFQVFITCSEGDDGIESEIIRNLISRSVDGLIVASATKKDQLTRNLPGNIPAVYIDRRIQTRTVSWVSSDNYQGAYDVVSHMCARGARDIFYFGGIEGIITSRDRLAGYKKALEDNQIVFHDKQVFHGDFTASSGYRMAREALAVHNGFPKAFFTASYTILEGILQFIKENVPATPANVRAGTFDDYPLLDHLPLRINSVRQDCRAMAQAAFELLEDYSLGRKARNRIIPVKLIVRDSPPVGSPR